MFVLIYNDDKMKFDKSIKIEDFKNRSQYKNDVDYRDSVDKLIEYKPITRKYQKYGLWYALLNYVLSYDYIKASITGLLQVDYKPSKGEKKLTDRDIIKTRDALLHDMYHDD